MSEPKVPGAILWQDLTVPDAQGLREFYQRVVGWTSKPHPVGEYDDYELQDSKGTTVAGLCHARGSNANLPAQWLVYVNVSSVKESAQQCVALGGRVLDGPRAMGGAPFCVIQDPAGAVLALIQG